MKEFLIILLLAGILATVCFFWQGTNAEKPNSSYVIDHYSGGLENDLG